MLTYTLTKTPDDKLLATAHTLAQELGSVLDINASLALWDGTYVPLGKKVSGPLAIRIADAGVISSLLKHPTLDRVIRHYVHGQIDIEYGTIVDLGEALGGKSSRGRLKKLPKGRIARLLLPFLLAPSSRPERTREFSGVEDRTTGEPENNRDLVQFHYDVGNEFYKLFLDPQLQYSCAYFTDWSNSLEQAQTDKLDMICRKLRLKEGDRFLDVGCGWGGLICHAVLNYGVQAHGITLSQEQLVLARERVESLGIAHQVSLELRDYADLTGTFDKIASVGMYEHIGVANSDKYFSTIRNVLAPDGLFLNHAISRRSKKKKKRFSARSEQRALQKYIFPGGELDDIGNTVAAMEHCGFEVHDVEAWREHYARTTRLWCERLANRKSEAIALVGEETYRIWVAYLGGCSLAFTRGSARIYQTLASFSAKGASPLPPTRSDLYR